MPEGDVLYRTAVTLQRWLVGREVTDCRSRSAGFPAHRVRGRSVDAVEAHGKHLLIRLDSGDTLHTHLRMSGSWHVYTAGEPWRRAEREARLVLTCGDRQAVCFNAPVVELVASGGDAVHPGLARLGPDALAQPLDVDEVRRRARLRPDSTTIGDLLLDQGVVAGIGNIYRCEALFLTGWHPSTPVLALTDNDLGALVTTAAELLGASAHGPGRPARRWVYKRSGRPCRRCGTVVTSRRQGDHARTAYWCPSCQPSDTGAEREPSGADSYTRRPQQARMTQRGANG